jgi:uncharacterized spore protein YtfJ
MTDAVDTGMDLHTLMTQVSDSLNAGRAFGPAYEHGGNTIIPVAFVVGGGGGGSGEAPFKEGAPPGQGSGRGAGFGSVSWPLGVYVVSNDRVKWVPAIDMTRVLLAAIGLVKVANRLAARRRSARTG